MLYNQPNPLEVKILSRRFGLPNSQSIETYLANDGSTSGEGWKKDCPGQVSLAAFFLAGHSFGRVGLDVFDDGFDLFQR